MNLPVRNSEGFLHCREAYFALTMERRLFSGFRSVGETPEAALECDEGDGGGVLPVLGQAPVSSEPGKGWFGDQRRGRTIGRGSERRCSDEASFTRPRASEPSARSTRDFDFYLRDAR
jgi:hypothetical protein